mgnify:CR=1 FL=1
MGCALRAALFLGMSSTPYQETPPSRQQSRWAEQFWRFEAKSDGDAIILPDGRSDVMFKFRRRGEVAEALEPIITAPATEPYVVEYNMGDCWVGARLQPTQTARLMRAVPDLSLGGIVPGAEAVAILCGSNAVTSEKLHESDLPTALERFVISLPEIAPLNGVREAIDLLHLTGGRIAAAMLGQSVGVSERHLRRTFQQAVGMSLKDYGQIVRFHRALRMLVSSQIKPAEVAYECGYADQAHMARSFKRFGGFTPSRVPENISLPGLPI